VSIKLAVVSRAGRGQYDIFGFDPTLGLSPRGCEESTGSGKQEGFAFGMDFGKAVGVGLMVNLTDPRNHLNPFQHATPSYG